MVVFLNKTYATHSEFPNTNFTDETDVYIVDETTGEGKELAQRIINAYPYYDFVIKDGRLVDIVELPKPEPEPTSPEPSVEEYLVDLDFRLSKMELGL
jgi:hypothetical protein